jgi:hypothetical protein
MEQGSHSIDPRLHIEAAAPVQNDDRPLIQLRGIHDQVVLSCREIHRRRRGEARFPRCLPIWRLRKVEAYVREQLAGEISVEALAGLVELSPFHFLVACLIPHLSMWELSNPWNPPV